VRQPTVTSDWAAMIEQLLAAGLTLADIGDSMGFAQLTDKMVRFYGMGVEPQEARRNALIDLWGKTTGKTLDQAPQMEVQYGRAIRRIEPKPQTPPTKQGKGKKREVAAS
jgi:hypothetical protein